MCRTLRHSASYRCVFNHHRLCCQPHCTLYYILDGDRKRTQGEVVYLKQIQIPNIAHCAPSIMFQRPNIAKRRSEDFKPCYAADTEGIAQPHERGDQLREMWLRCEDLVSDS